MVLERLSGIDRLKADRASVHKGVGKVLGLDVVDGVVLSLVEEGGAEATLPASLNPYSVFLQHS